MTTDCKDICRRLGEERKRLRLKQNKVAELCGVSSKTVSRWEKTIPIPADKLAMLIGHGYDFAYVLTGTPLSDRAVNFADERYLWKKEHQESHRIGTTISG